MKSTVLFASAAVSCIVVSSIFADEKQKHTDPSGTWRWEYNWQGETVNHSIQLNLEHEGKVVGIFKGRNSTVKFNEGKIEGDKLSVTFPIDFQGTEVLLSFSGKIKGDKIDGVVVAEVNGEAHEFPWKPKRSVKMDDVVGTWQIRIESSDGNVFEPTLKISKDDDKFTSVYTTMQGQELEVKDLRVEKNNLMFTMTAEFDGNTLRVDYKGRPYGNKISGALEYDFSGNSGDGEFIAKRKQEKKD